MLNFLRHRGYLNVLLAATEERAKQLSDPRWRSTAIVIYKRTDTSKGIVMGTSTARRPYVFYALLIVISITMSGCLSGCAVCEGGNAFSERGTDHCYQWLSVKLGETDGCDKIPGTGFTGQNPPKDKCYLMVAEKNVDPEPCANIEGGFNSYTSDECYQNVGAKGGTADQCDGLSGAAQTECRTGVARGQDSEGMTPSCGAGYTWVAGGMGGGSCVKAPEPKEPSPEKTTGTQPTTKTTTAKTTTTKTTDTTTAKTTGTTTPDTTTTKSTTPTVDKTGSEKTTDTTPPGDKPVDDRPIWEKILDKVTGGMDAADKVAAGAQDAAQSAADKVKAVFTSVEKNPNPTPEQEKGSRLSESLKDVEDEEERNAIAREFIKQREAQDAKTLPEQQALLEKIKAQREQNKKLDDLANTLKTNTYDKARDAATEAATDAAKEKLKDMATGWIDKNAPPKAKGALDKAQGAYDKANEKMEKLGGKIDKAKGYYDKAKGVYDDVKDVTDKIKTIQDKASSGAIDPGRARVLKGGVLLGKGLEKATSYIPVFGETASTVTKETFGVAINVATTKAERSTKMDDCFIDPANCDTDGISGY